MKKKRKIIIAIFFLVLLYILGSYVVKMHFIYHGLVPWALRVRVVISEYVELNNGCFPVSESDLIGQNFLRKSTIENETYYYWRSFHFDPNKLMDERSWSHLGLFKLFTLAYGATAGDMELNDGRLYNKITHEQILLINGPHEERLKGLYESISRDWYEQMLEQQRAVAE